MEQNNNKLIIKLVAGVIGMFGFGFALVPLYDVFCQVTGINGRVVVQADESDLSTVDTSRTVTVEFITRKANGVTFQFEALNHKVKLHPGEYSEVAFRVKNPKPNQAFAQAVPSVSPGKASLYLNKTECFCFTQQSLNAHEEVVYPMKFFLDQELPESIKVLTVSYTLYEVNSEDVVASVSMEDKENVEQL